MQFTRRATTVHAEEWTDENVGSVAKLLMRSKSRWVMTAEPGEMPELSVVTVDENTVFVPLGAYVVIDPKGYAYPCDAEIFEQAHELAPMSKPARGSVTTV